MKLKSVIIVVGCLALVATDAMSEPLGDVPGERLSYYMSSPPYGWSPYYDIEFLNQELHVYTSIYLYGTGGVTQQQIDALEPTWENGIEGLWNDSYQISHDNSYYYDIIYDVTFVENPLSDFYHYQVRVRPGPERSNMLTWDTEDTPQVAAHEYGHMVGNYDEYSGGATNPSNPIIDSTSIMGSTSPAAVSYARHYEPVVDWLEGKYPSAMLEVVAIPEPTTLGLVLLGVALAGELSWLRGRRRS